MNLRVNKVRAAEKVPKVYNTKMLESGVLETHNNCPKIIMGFR
jgi:hypothetical protein